MLSRAFLNVTYSYIRMSFGRSFLFNYTQKRHNAIIHELQGSSWFVVLISVKITFGSLIKFSYFQSKSLEYLVILFWYLIVRSLNIIFWSLLTLTKNCLCFCALWPQPVEKSLRFYGQVKNHEIPYKEVGSSIQLNAIALSNLSKWVCKIVLHLYIFLV